MLSLLKRELASWGLEGTVFSAEGIESAMALGQECQWYLRMRKEEELG